MKQTMIQIAIVAVVASITGCSTLPCGKTSGWTQWKTSDGGNGHYYKAVAVTNGVTWTEADKIARAEGGYLATITSGEESAFVLKVVSYPQFFSAANGTGLALGGFQQDGAKEPDGGWCWVTGEPWNYSRWVPGQPDNYGGQEDRLSYFSGISRTPAATWNDVNRNLKELAGYVIERDK